MNPRPIAPKAQDGPPAATGEPDEDLDALAEVTDGDVKQAVRSWKELAPERFRGLIEAREYEGK